jgi:hypothetical protein
MQPLCLMRGISLVSYGNAFLRGTPFHPSHFYPGLAFNNSRADFLPSEASQEYRSPARPPKALTNPIEWLDYLQAQRTDHIFLTPPELVKEMRLMETTIDRPYIVTSRRTAPRQFSLWKCHDETATEVPCWQHPAPHVITFAELPIPTELTKSLRPYEEHTLQKAANRLSTVLKDIRDFSIVYAHNQYVQRFEDALRVLSNHPQQPPPDSRIEILVPSLTMTDDARQVLHAALASFVFGGLGSWTNVHTSQPEEQGRLASELLTAINHAVCAAVNTTTVAHCQMVD